MLIDSGITIYKGDTPISKVYKGSSVIWELNGDISLNYIANGEDSTSGGTRDIVFNTDVQPSSTIRIEVKFRTLNTQLTQALIATINRKENRYFQCIIKEGKVSLQTYINQCDTAGGLTTDDHIAVLFNEDSHNKITLDNVTYQSSYTTKIYPKDSKLGLFARYSTTDSDAKCYGGTRLYYIKIWDKDTLIRNYVPVLHSGTPCFKDNVSGNYIYNLGTDTLSYG